MVNAGKASDNKVTKRGLTEDPSVARRKDKLPLGPLMIGFFLFVVIGSCTSPQPRPSSLLSAPLGRALSRAVPPVASRSRAADHQPGRQGLDGLSIIGVCTHGRLGCR